MDKLNELYNKIKNSINDEEIKNKLNDSIENDIHSQAQIESKGSYYTKRIDFTNIDDMVSFLINQDRAVLCDIVPSHSMSHNQNTIYLILPYHLRNGYIDSSGRIVEDRITILYGKLLKETKLVKRNEIYEKIRSILKELYIYDSIAQTNDSSQIDDEQGLDDNDSVELEQDDADQDSIDFPENKEENGEANVKGHVKKDNMFKSLIMTRAVDHSATAIWTPDPRLSIGSIAISEKIHNELPASEGDYLLIWRDPVLRDASVRYMQVAKIDPDLTGIAINPVVAKGFDGDFDGDTVAVVNLCPCQNQKDSDKDSIAYKAHEEALGKFTVENNLIDEGRNDGSLIINTGLDLISANAGIDNEDEMNEIDLKIKEAFERDFYLGDAIINLEDEKAVIASFVKIKESGAKKGNIDNYTRYFDNKMTEEDRIKVQTATAIKAAVGIAGRYSQQLMRIFRGKCPKAALELTYPNTQALLQIKHDPDKAKTVYKCLRDDLIQAWRKQYKTKDEGIDALKRIYDGTLDQGSVKEEYFKKVFDNIEPIEKIVTRGNDKGKSKVYYSVINQKNSGSTIDEWAYPIGKMNTLIFHFENLFNEKDTYSVFFRWDDTKNISHEY